MSRYSDVLMAHFLSPRNVGVLEGAPWGGSRHDACGDCVRFHVEVSGGLVARCGFLASGCGPVRACTSWLTVRVTGVPVEEAARVSVEEVSGALGLPAQKEHCAHLAVVALRRALRMAVSRGVCPPVAVPRVEGEDGV